MSMEQNNKSDLVSSLGFPKDLLLGEVNLRLTGQRQIFIENYRYIIEYSEDILKIQCKNTKLKILGKKLVIEYFSKEEMLVRGIVSEIIFC